MSNKHYNDPVNGYMKEAKESLKTLREVKERSKNEGNFKEGKSSGQRQANYSAAKKVEERIEKNIKKTKGRGY